MEYRNPRLKRVAPTTLAAPADSEERCGSQRAVAVGCRISASADNHRLISNHRGLQVYMACFDQYAHPRTSGRSAVLRMVPVRDQRVSPNKISLRSLGSDRFDEMRFRQTKQDYLSSYPKRRQFHGSNSHDECIYIYDVLSLGFLSKRIRIDCAQARCDAQPKACSRRLSEIDATPIYSQVAKSQTKNGLTRWRGFCIRPLITSSDVSTHLRPG
jgi:hypothetical protein